VPQVWVQQLETDRSPHLCQYVFCKFRGKKSMLDKRQQLFQFAKTLQLKKGNALQCGLQYMAPSYPLRIILPSTKWESDRLKDREHTYWLVHPIPRAKCRVNGCFCGMQMSKGHTNPIKQDKPMSADSPTEYHQFLFIPQWTFMTPPKLQL
jgi:hypothetical protein